MKRRNKAPRLPIEREVVQKTMNSEIFHHLILTFNSVCVMVNRIFSELKSEINEAEKLRN